MKAAFTIRTGNEMALHNSDFLGAELSTKVEMETSNSLITVHYKLSSNMYPPTGGSFVVYLLILTYKEGLSFPRRVRYTAIITFLLLERGFAKEEY